MKCSFLATVLCGLATAAPVTESSLSSGHVTHLTRRSAWHKPAYAASLGYPWGSHYFYADVIIGSQSFNLVADLGSCNLWVPGDGYQCLAEPCGLQSTYHADSTLIPLANESFLASYGAGAVAGATGFEKVSVAGLTVPKQQFGIGSVIDYQAYGQSSGIMGLAFSSGTGFYNGTNLTADTLNQNKLKIASSSLIGTIFNVDKLTAPVLSLALSRDASNNSYGGVLVIGGVPNFKLPTVNASSSYATVPIAHDPALPGKQYRLYYFNSTGVSFSNATAKGSNDTTLMVVADSGAPTISLPKKVAKEINAMFDPPAKVVDGAYVVDCNAKPPNLSFKVGGRDFHIAPQDLIYHAISNETAKANSAYAIECASAIQPASSGTLGQYIMGEPFLKNVLGVFDWGKHEIRWHAREYYES